MTAAPTARRGFLRNVAVVEATPNALADALTYAAKGWHVFPVPPGEKKSYKSAKFSDGRPWGATTDAEEVRRDFGHWPKANVGIVTGPKSGIFVVECDTLEGHDVDGIASLEVLIAKYGPLPDTLMVESPSGSVHRYFRYPDGETISNSASKVGPGIDVRGDGGMVIAPRSVKPDVGTYRWLNDNAIAEAPDWLIALCQGKQAQGQNSPKQGQLQAADPDEVTAALAVIPSDDENVWFEIGCALHNALGDDGHDLYVSWTAKSDKYDPAECDQKWEHCKTNKGYNVGTIFHYANEAQPGWRDEYIERTSSGSVSDGSDDEKAEPSWMLELNDKFAWIEREALIYRLEFDDFIQPAAFCTQFSNRYITMQTDKGVKRAPVGRQWLQEPGRRQHKGLTLRPGEPLLTSDNYLNEWRGFSVGQVPGDVMPFLKLLTRLVPDRNAALFVINWFAHLLQHPGIKMHTSLVLWSSNQGVGKNLLFECIVSIFGKRHASVIHQAELESDFNGWMAGKVFVIGDEVFSSEKRQHENKLKGLITSTELHINEKFQPRRALPNRINFLFLSNKNDAMFLADHDRRYFIWEIEAPPLTPAEVQDFLVWRDGGGLGHLLDWFLKIRIKDFNPKAAAPVTAAKLQMIEDSRSDLEAWVAELMGSNVAQILGRELATGAQLARRYASETNQRTPSTKTVVSAFKRHGAFARTNQVRLSNGKKLRALALSRPDYWKGRTEAEWAAELERQQVVGGMPQVASDTTTRLTLPQMDASAETQTP